MPTITSIANQAVFDLLQLVMQRPGYFMEGLEVVFLPQPDLVHRPLEPDPERCTCFDYTAFEAQAATAFHAVRGGGGNHRARTNAVGAAL